MAIKLEQRTAFVPLHHVSWNLQEKLPIDLTVDLSVENVAGVLKAHHFDLWRNYVSENDRRDFESMRIALVRHYEAPELSREFEDGSEDLLYKVFLCMRLVKPTNTRFSVVYVRKVRESEIDVLRFTHPAPLPLNMPPSQTVNAFTAVDLYEVRDLVPAFFKLAKDGPENLRRAVRFYEEGYSDVRDPVLQLVVWVMGIEAACFSEDRILTREELSASIGRYLPLDSKIFAQIPLGEFTKMPVVTVGEVVMDLFTLRDRFIHGLWIPGQWKERTVYADITGKAVVYPDALRDGASFILRRLIMSMVTK